MDLLGLWSLAIAKRLGISVVAPANIELKSGNLLDVSAVFPQFGAEKGMAVVDSFEKVAAYHDELIGSGYGYSCLAGNENSDTEDLESVMEMFKEWGWSGNRNEAPFWLVRDDE